MSDTVHGEFSVLCAVLLCLPRRVVATPGGFFKKQEMKDDEGKTACPAVSCAGSGVGCLGSRAGAAEIQPGRGSVVALESNMAGIPGLKFMRTTHPGFPSSQPLPKRKRSCCVPKV